MGGGAECDNERKQIGGDSMAVVAMGELKEIDLAPQTEIEDATQCVSMILNTPRGTVPFMRDFGLSTSYLHRPTRGDINTIAADVADQLEAYETRIEAEDMIFSEDQKDGLMNCAVPFELAEEDEEDEDE